MTEEQIKEKAEAEADKVIIGSGMDRTSVIHLKHLLVTMYIQGATKVTKELEKENAELKEELTKKADTNHSLVEQMADLESENAELKEKYVKECEDVAFVVTNYNKQLTKAKEIIKKLVRVEYADFTNGDYSNELSKVLEQAEQFLKETE